MDRNALLQLIGEEDDTDSTDVGSGLMLHIAAAAKADGVDMSDKDSIDAFIDQLKALVTRDKAQLMKTLRKYGSRTGAQVGKLAMRAESGFDRAALLAIVEEGGTDVASGLMLHLAAAAKADGVDMSDKDSISAFIDQLKAFVTRDKAVLMKALRKYGSKTGAQVGKLALKAEGKSSPEDKAVLDACGTLIGQLETNAKFLQNSLYLYAKDIARPTDDGTAVKHVVADMKKVHERLAGLAVGSWARLIKANSYE